MGPMNSGDIRARLDIIEREVMELERSGFERSVPTAVGIAMTDIRSAVDAAREALDGGRL